jgi:hypothetical protein
MSPEDFCGTGLFIFSFLVYFCLVSDFETAVCVQTFDANRQSADLPPMLRVKNTSLKSPPEHSIKNDFL